MNNYTFILSKYDGLTLNKDSVSRINIDLQIELQKLKNNIENNHLWDTAKRNMNEYEYIFSSSKKHTKICKKILSVGHISNYGRFSKIFRLSFLLRPRVLRQLI